MFTFPLTLHSGAAVPFAPDQVAGLSLWLDASDGSTITKSGDDVSLWADKSSNGYDLVQVGGAALRPHHGTHTVNSLDVMDFDGVSQCVQSTDLMSDMIIASEFSLFVVYQIDVYPTGVGFNAFKNAAAVADSKGLMGLHVADVSGVDKVQAYHTDGVSDTVQFATSTATPYLSTMRHGGGNLYHSIDGGAETSAASGDSTNLTGIFRAGSNYNLSKYFDGQIAEIVLYNNDLSVSDRTAINNYLIAKWGL